MKVYDQGTGDWRSATTGELMEWERYSHEETMVTEGHAHVLNSDGTFDRWRGAGHEPGARAVGATPSTFPGEPVRTLDGQQPLDDVGEPG